MKPESTRPEQIFDRKALKEKKEEIVSSNRWDYLRHLDLKEREQQNKAVELWLVAAMESAKDAGAYRDRRKRGLHLTRLEKAAVDTYRSEFELAVKTNGSLQDGTAALQLARAKARAAVKQLKTRELERVIADGARLYDEHDMRGFFQWASAFCKRKRGTSLKINALHDNEGNIGVGKQEVADILGTHYGNLAKAANLDNNWPDNSPAVDARLNQRFNKGNLIVVLQELKSMKAAGKDGIPPEFYKLLSYKEEAEGPPELSRPGVQLLTILNKMVQEGNSGDLTLNEATVVSLFKKGDSQDPANYRGISLINIISKIAAKLTAKRFQRYLEESGKLVNTQAGFHKSEGTIGQVITLFEIVQHRAIQGLATYGVFIDFKKVFDLVNHEALFYKCCQLGLDGKILKCVKHLYENSSSRARNGDAVSERFNLASGVQQGCPLSTTLFTVFVNNIFDNYPHGVEVPGLGAECCPGLQFADDTIGLGGSLENLGKMCDHLTAWAVKWGMQFGIDKCGLIVLNGSVEQQVALDKAEIRLGGQKVPVVLSYTYLGVEIRSDFGSNGSVDHGMESHV